MTAHGDSALPMHTEAPTGRAAGAAVTTALISHGHDGLARAHALTIQRTRPSQQPTAAIAGTATP